MNKKELDEKEILDVKKDDSVTETTTEPEGEEEEQIEEIQIEEEEEETIPPIIDPKPELIKIDQIKGVGRTTVAKLKEMGIEDIADLAIANAIDIHEKLASSKHSLHFCQSLIVYADQYLQQSGILKNALITAAKVLEDELTRDRYSTGDELIDEWLGGGGIQSRAVTEFYGRFKSGKTQICYCIAVTAASNDKNVLFIDTENTFSATRIKQIASHRKLNISKVMENIKIMPTQTASMLTINIKQLARHIKENNIKVIIVDSIIALHRAEFIGRANLANRQQELGQIMSYLVKCAKHYNIAVIMTNQVLESPDPFKPGQYATGGNIISHGSTHRILLRPHTPTRQGGNRSFSTAIMEDSPSYARTELMIELGPYGVRGIDASKPMPKA